MHTSSISYSKVIKSLHIIGALFIITYIVTLSINLSQETTTKAGSIGDTLGGLASPFIGTMGVIVTFLAFWVQFEANERQRADIKRERFENKFYELLRLHKENVKEVNINHGKYTGRSAFIKIYDEYYYIFKTCKRLIKHSDIEDFNPDNITIHKAAFDILMYGVGQTSNRHREPIDTDNFRIFLKKAATHFEAVQRSYENKHSEDGARQPPPPAIMDIPSETLEEQEYLEVPEKLNYRPADGHLSRLNHYFRHYYHLVKFIATNDSVGLTQNEKYDYIKILRAQLSTHELALLYFNSLWHKGERMWKDEVGSKIYYYNLDFKLHKNLPFYLCDFGIKPNEKYLTEWCKRLDLPEENIDIKNTIYDSFEETEGYRDPK